MLPEELLWVIALLDIPTYRAMVMAIPLLARKITLGTQCNHKIHFGYNVKVENMYGYQRISWSLNGKLHRTDGPAIEYTDGDKHYYINGKLHRTDDPAIERADGYKAYCLNGKRHRTDGPAIEYADGGNEWYQYGELHRTDGPAVVWGSKKEYYLNGKLHRTDGPAIEYTDGGKEYWLDGIKCYPQ